MTTTLFELAMVVLLATGLGIMARILRQPTILGYLVAGALIGAFGFLNLSDEATLRVFSDLGVMFLLFLVGLEINYASQIFLLRSRVFWQALRSRILPSIFKLRRVSEYEPFFLFWDCRLMQAQSMICYPKVTLSDGS